MHDTNEPFRTRYQREPEIIACLWQILSDKDRFPDALMLPYEISAEILFN